MGGGGNTGSTVVVGGATVVVVVAGADVASAPDSLPHADSTATIATDAASTERFFKRALAMKEPDPTFAHHVAERPYRRTETRAVRWCVAGVAQDQVWLRRRLTSRVSQAGENLDPSDSALDCNPTGK